MICLKCKLEKAESEFSFRENGKPRSECKACKVVYASAYRLRNAEMLKQKRDAGYLLNRDVMLARQKAWRLVNKNKVKEANMVWRAANTEELKAKKAAWYQANKARITAAVKIKNAANPEIVRDQKLRQAYGIGLEKYKEMLVVQAGVCAICKMPETAVRNGRLLPLSVDHDHKTGRIRGLLCKRHNHGIGHFQDSVEEMRAAIEYLEASAASERSAVMSNG